MRQAARPSDGAHLLRPDAALPEGEVRREGGVTRIGAAGVEGARSWEALGAKAVAAAPAERRRVALDATALPPADGAAFALGAAIRHWRFDELKLAPRRQTLEALRPAATPEWARLDALLPAIAWARRQVAEPGNRLTPASFAERLAKLERHGLRVRVLDAKALRKRGAGGILAVGGGSATPPCLVELSWPGRFRAPPVAFIGKGICFDTGGVSVKPAAGMEAMRADMAGAAACAGAMLALALRDSPCPAVAVLALADIVEKEAR